jgi:hypothetical protein
MSGISPARAQDEHGMPGLQPRGQEGQQQPIASLAAAEEKQT